MNSLDRIIEILENFKEELKDPLISENKYPCTNKEDMQSSVNISDEKQLKLYGTKLSNGALKTAEVDKLINLLHKKYGLMP